MSQKPAQIWAAQVRAPFLILSVLLVLIGAGAAAADGVFDLLRVLLCVLGTVLAHVGVNLFNEVSDHTTGIDDNTRRTPFSGGSGTLQAGLTSRRAVSTAAWTSSAAALLIGLYLCTVSGWALSALIAGGAVASLFYTSHLARWSLGELAAGTTLGTFVVLGTYYAQAATLTTSVILLSIPPGVLTALLLLLNEFPDAEADRAGGRRHLVILLGHRGAAILYSVLLASTYAFIVAGAAVGWFPPTLLLALLTLPLAWKAASTALKHGSEHEPMLPALGANVGLVLGTDLMLAAGMFLA